MNSKKQPESDLIYEDEFLQLTTKNLILRAFKPWSKDDLKLPLTTIRKIKEVRLAIYNGLTWHEKAWLEFRWPHDWKVKNRKEGFLIRSSRFPIPIGITCREPQVLGINLRKLLPDTF